MKAIIFDFNGTLFDDTRFHIAAWQCFMREKFGLELTLEEVYERCIGPNNPTILRNYFGERFTWEEAMRLGREKEAVYRRIVCSDPANLHLMEGAEELFDLLAEREIPFALATTSEADNIHFYREELGLKKWFALERIVYDDGKLPAKPDPAFYLEAMRRLNVAPEDCLIVEDSPLGIQAARSARPGRIIAMDRTAPLEWLKAQPEIHAVIHDFHHFERYL